MNGQLNLTADQLACLFGEIDVYGATSLYKRLFLNKSLQRINAVFQPGKNGDYLSDPNLEIRNYIPDLLAAFKISSDQFNKIIADTGLDLSKAKLTIPNLSLIYRYVILSKALSISINDLCIVKDIFKIQPFTYFDAANGKFVKADPKESHSFVSLINDIKSSGFKISTLQYILGSNENGSANVNAIKETQLLDAIKMIRDGFNQINDDHPENEGTVIDDEVLRKKLSIIFKKFLGCRV